MNLSELNLDVNTYTDARLQKNFGLPDNYTKEDVVGATNRLASVASASLGPEEEEAFNGFLRAAEERLLKKKMVESSSPAWTDAVGHMDPNDLLPSDRELTIIRNKQRCARANPRLRDRHPTTHTPVSITILSFHFRFRRSPTPSVGHRRPSKTSPRASCPSTANTDKTSPPCEETDN